MKKWLKYLRNEFPTVAFKATTQTQKHNLVSEEEGICSTCTFTSISSHVHVSLKLSITCSINILLLIAVYIVV